MNELTDDEKFKILNHLCACSECQFEFHVLREVSIPGKVLTRDLATLAGNRQNLASLTKLAQNEIERLKSRTRTERKSFWPSKRWAVGISGAVVVLGTILSLTLLRRTPEYGVERNMSPLGITLLKPQGQVPFSHLVFNWTIQEKVKYYSLEILDQGLQTVYGVDLIREDIFSLPDEILRRLKSGDIYFWKITATTENDERIESNLAKFTLNRR